jgi:hypothetical protein
VVLLRWPGDSAGAEGQSRFSHRIGLIQQVEVFVANFPIQRQTLTSRAPIYPDLEKLTLAFSLTKLREALGPDDAFVRKVLGTKAPASLAAELVDNTKLADIALRRGLIDADEATIATTDDPMIAFARQIDPDLRTLRQTYEDEVQAELTKNST